MKDKTNIVLAIIIGCFVLAMLAAPFIAGPSSIAPKVLSGTWVSETVSLTFSGMEDVKAVCGEETAEFIYTNGTTGTNLVIWFDLEENCPEEFDFLKSSRENYLVYSEGEDQGGAYLEIDGVKYYKQS